MKSTSVIITTKLAPAVLFALGTSLGAVIDTTPALATNIIDLSAGGAGVGGGATTSARGSSATFVKSRPSKLTLGLDTLSAEYQAFEQAVARRAAAPGTFVTQKTAARVIGESVVIDAIAAGDPEDLNSALEALGAKITAVAGRMVSARLPLNTIPSLETIEELQFARPAWYTTRAGIVNSQGDAAQRSDLARTDFGIDGTGSTVGVLSDSFDCTGSGGGYASDILSGDLPLGVIILEDLVSGCTDEGRAMAQIVHDVAPGAGQAFHTASGGEAGFAQGILDLQAAGANIIVDDVIYFAEPMFQDGIVAQAVDTVEMVGVPYFSSAGNNGRESYEAAFLGSGVTGPLGGEMHDFDPGPGTDTRLELTQSADTIFILQWSNPFFSVSGAPGAQTDLTICFYAPPGSPAPLGCTQNPNMGGDPVDGIVISGGGALEISIENLVGADPPLVKAVMFGSIIFTEVYPGTNASTLYGHANAAGANAVGASAYFFTPAFGQVPPLLNDYSSAGNTPILFDIAGNPILEVRQKPEFTAPDGGNNTFFGSDYEPDGRPNFFGTSAAAPHAAAVAALMREADPSLTTAEITTGLQNNAIDILNRNTGELLGTGFDYDSGTGLIDAYTTLKAVVQLDSDGDGLGDLSDPDDDNDGIVDWADPDPLNPSVALAPVYPVDAAATVNNSWVFIDAASGYLDAVVIAGPPTYHGLNPGVVRLRSVTDLGFDLCFQEWDYRQRIFGDTYHAFENIPYLVLQPGRHTLSDGSIWEVGTFDLGGTGTWQAELFSQPFTKAPNLFLTVQTENDPQAVSVRARNLTASGFEAALLEEEALMEGHLPEAIGYLAIESTAGGGQINLDGTAYPYLLQSLKTDERWSPVLSHRIKVEEEESKDSEVGHVDETLHVLALGDQLLAQQVSHNGGDTTALRCLAPTADAPMEWGMIRGIDHNWQTLPFYKTYDHPVLVIKPASNNGVDPGVIRLQDVTATHAQLRYQEWNYLDTRHTKEDVFYLVSEAGEHNLGGLTVKANWLTSNKLGRAGQWESIAFNALFPALPPGTTPAPVVLASVMTYNGADTVATRIDNLDLSIFDLAMDEQESKSDGHVTETLGWIAIQQGVGTTAEGRKIQVFFDQIDHNLTPVVYTNALSHRHPTVLGGAATTKEADPVSLRYANPTNAQIQLKLTEETSADAETDHALEDVGLFVGE